MIALEAKEGGADGQQAHEQRNYGFSHGRNSSTAAFLPPVAEMPRLDNIQPKCDAGVVTLRTVAVVLPPQAAVFEFGVAHEVFALDRTDDGVPPFDFRACTEDPTRPIQMIGGLELNVPYGLEAAEDADLVIVPAYALALSDKRPSEALLGAVRRAHDRGAWVLSVCSGAFLLGHAGLLDGRRCTTHWRHAARLQSEFPKSFVEPDVLFVEDGTVISSAGTAAGIDACLHHVRCELGAEVANRIARRMVVPPQRDGGQRQYIAAPVPETTAESLQPVLEWMLDHLEEDISVGALADQAAMSERTFARRFVAETGTTPAKWLQARRVHHARTLLETTHLTIEQVARRAGFGSSALLRHHFSSQVGVAPAEYRRTFQVTDVVGQGSSRTTVSATMAGFSSPSISTT